MDQNQTADKNSADETQSWLVAWLDASHRNPTPYFGGQNLESFALGASLAQPAISRPIAGLTRVRAHGRKICISDKAGAQSRLLAEGSRLFIPPPVFARCRGSFWPTGASKNRHFTLKNRLCR